MLVDSGKQEFPHILTFAMGRTCCVQDVVPYTLLTDKDLSVRDAIGEWQPENLPQPSPMWDRPVRLKAILKVLFGRDSILWPKQFIYMATAIVMWLFLTPSLDHTATFQFNWIAEIYLRNVTLLVLVAGGLHLRLYVQRAQGKNTSLTHAG